LTEILPYDTKLGSAWGATPRTPDLGLEIKLPIGFVGEDGNLYKNVVIDEMTGVDDEIISNPRYRKNPVQAMTHLFRRVIQEVPGLIPQKKNRFGLISSTLISGMHVADRDYLMICMAIASFGETYDHDWACSRCGSEHTTEVELRRVAVVDHPEGQDRRVEFTLPRPVRVSGKDVSRGEIRFPVTKDQEIAAQSAGGLGVQATKMLALLITDMEGARPSLEEVRRFSSNARRAISAAIEQNLPGVDLSATISCEDCGATQKEALNISAFFGSS